MNNDVRRLLFPQFILFFLLGAAFAAWATRIPAIRDLIGLTPSTLTWALMARGLGTVAVFPLSAWLVNRFGPRTAAVIAGYGMLLSIPLLSLAPAWYFLAMTLFLAGAAAGSYDVAINALGAATEKQSGLSFMSKLHAWFGVGNFTGALLGSAAAKAGLSPVVHFSLSSAALAVVLLVLTRYLPSPSHQPVERRRFELPHGGLVMLGVIVFFASITESQVNSWVTLLFSDRLNASDDLAPAGYAAFAGSLLLLRLAGDRLKVRFGARRVLITGAWTASAALAAAAFSNNLMLTVAAFACAGAGLAVIFPYVFSAAGREGAHALASVATLGYVGGILAPPMMGFMVDRFTIGPAFLLLSATAAGIGIAGLRARLLR